MSYNIVEQAKKCLRCKNPGCRKGCPVQTNIPDMMQLFLQGDIVRAGEMLFQNNPLSSICSLVCDIGNQCQGHCVLSNKGAPVNISAVESYISERYLETVTHSEYKKSGNKVAIIGAGPAGLTIAIKLAQKGHDVTIFEAKPRIGGVLRYGIPEFRLPKKILDKFQTLLEKFGIKIKPNVTIGKPYGIEELFRDGFKAINISTGVAWPNNLNIKGETLAHVHYGIHYLKEPDVYRLGDNVIVIGGGNVAIDVGRTALRKGSKNVNIVIRGDHFSAIKEEIEMAKIDGAKFLTNLMPVEINEDGVYFVSTTLDENHKVIQVSDDKVFYPADSVLVAVGQKASNLIVKQTQGVQATQEGLAVTSDNGVTGRVGVFASGDVVMGAKTVVEAVQLSKAVAEAMDFFLKA